MTEIVLMMVTLYAVAIIFVLSRVALDVQQDKPVLKGLYLTLPMAVVPVVIAMFPVRIGTVVFMLGLLVAYIFQALKGLVQEAKLNRLRFGGE